jgi:hypothetical protein
VICGDGDGRSTVVGQDEEVTAQHCTELDGDDTVTRLENRIGELTHQPGFDCAENAADHRDADRYRREDFHGDDFHNAFSNVLLHGGGTRQTETVARIRQGGQDLILRRVPVVHDEIAEAHRFGQIDRHRIYLE